MSKKHIIQVEEKVPGKLLLPLSLQHMFAMFGASVLVPFLFGINPAIVLFMNGIGTLLFILITKGKAPAYLGSSFAFIAPANIVISKFGYPYALGGFVAVGFCGCLLAFIIKKCGTKWIDIVLPPAAMGPVVALIGLELSATAANNAGLLGDNIQISNVCVFLITLGVAVLGNICFRKFLSVIPILIAIICGYIAAICFGLVDFSAVIDAPLFALPNFTTVPTTTYGENIGVMAITGVYSVQVIAGAAIISIICSFVGPLSALIQTIPGPVIGGISFLLYGMIGTSGLRILVDQHVDYSINKNLILTSIVFVTGLSSITLDFGGIQLTGMVLACIIAMILSLLFYILEKFNLTNDN